MLVDPTFLAFPIDALKSLTERDPELVRRNRRQGRALLGDHFPEYGLQVGVLAAALEVGVPEALKGAAERGALTIEAGRLAQMLVARYGYQEYIARWGVAAWAFALGYWDEEHVSSTLTVAEPVEPKRTVDETRTGETLGAAPAPPVDGASGHRTATANHDGDQRASGPGVSPPGARLPRNALIVGLAAALIVIGGVVVGARMTNAFGPQPTPTPVPTSTPVPTPTPVPNASAALTSVQTLACWGSAPDNISGCPPHANSVGPCYQGNPQWSPAAGCPVTSRLERRLRQNPTSGHPTGGADPICRCQNLPSYLNFHVIKKSNTVDLINVIWPWQPSKATITFTVVNKGGQWLVDDMYCAGYPGTSIYSTPVTNCA